MPKSRNVLNKVYELCKARGFVVERRLTLPKHGQTTVLDFGPLGVEIKRNLLNQWWHEIVTSRENVCGLDLGLGSQAFDVGVAVDYEQNLCSYLPETYHYACDLIGADNIEDSIGLAQNLSILQGTNNSVNEFMFRSQRKDFCKLCFFCHPNKVSYWTDYWMRKRLSWWKKYADMPAEFSLIDCDYRNHFYQGCDKVVSDTMAVQFNFPWGTEAVECISSYSNVQTLLQNETYQDYNLGLVVATANVERGILAYLLDAFHENQYLDSHGIPIKQSKLRLHPAFAPIKVAVFSNNTLNADLGRVAQQLASELRQAGIPSQYFEVEQNCDNFDQCNWQQDEIGTLYAVAVQDSSLTNGIVALRNRDTTLSEFLHISEVLKTVQRHLDGF